MGEKYTVQLECSQKTNGMNDVISFGIQVQRRVNQGDCPANTEITVLCAYLIYSPVNIRTALRHSILWKQRQLRHFIRWCKTADFYGEASDRTTTDMAVPKNIHGRFPYCRCTGGSVWQFELTIIGSQIIVSNSHAHSCADASLLPKPRSYAFT